MISAEIMNHRGRHALVPRSCTFYCDGSRIGSFYFSDSIEKGALHVMAFHIKDNLQGRGYGKQMAKEMVELAKKLKDVGIQVKELTLDAISPCAEHVYESAGFKATSPMTFWDDGIRKTPSRMQINL